MTLDDCPVDAFYAAPAVGFDVRPGAILRYRSTIVPTLGRPHQAWQLVYATHTGRHAPIPASGIVIARPRSRRAVVIAACDDPRGRCRGRLVARAEWDRRRLQSCRGNPAAVV